MAVTIDRDVPLQFLRAAFQPDDWVAVLLKCHDTGGTAQRVGPLSLVAHPRFQAWLRAHNAKRFSVYISVNAIRPQRKARTRDAIGKIRHVFLDVDREGERVLGAVEARRDLPKPSYVLHSSPSRLHVLWRVTGVARQEVETLQKRLASELNTDKAATSCTQMTRIPGFFNHKYRPGSMVDVDYCGDDRVFLATDFAAVPAREPVPVPSAAEPSVIERARRYLAAIPPAVAGHHGDVATFRVCCRLARGFALDDVEAMAVLEQWNAKCEPPWSERELRAKLHGARRYGRESIGGLLRSSIQQRLGRQ